MELVGSCYHPLLFVLDRYRFRSVVLLSLELEEILFLISNFETAGSGPPYWLPSIKHPIFDVLGLLLLLFFLCVYLFGDDWDQHLLVGLYSFVLIFGS